MKLLEGLIERQWPEVLRVWPAATLAPLHNRGYIVCVPEVKLRKGAWNTDWATIWFLLPLGFPMASPVNFYVRQELTLRHGGWPSHTTRSHPFHDGKEADHGWMECVNRPTYWNPNQSTISTYVRMCQVWFEARLRVAA